MKVDFETFVLADVKMNHVRTGACTVSIRNMAQGSDPGSIGKRAFFYYSMGQNNQFDKADLFLIREEFKFRNPSHGRIQLGRVLPAPLQSLHG